MENPQDKDREYINQPNLNALRDKFCDWLYNSLDYAYYNPAEFAIDKTDKTKYPVMIFLHWMWHWRSQRRQINDSLFPYMASEKMQSRFNEKWAHLLVPRIPIHLPGFVSTDKLQWMIEDYIEKNEENIDTNQITVTWSSAGSTLAWRLLTKNPDFYSNTLIACPAVVPTNKELEKTQNAPIWMVSSRNDHTIPYFIQEYFRNKIKETTAVPDQCRQTVFDWDVFLPDWRRMKNPHLLANIFTSDFIPFRTPKYEDVKYDWENYPNTTTITADGRIIPTQWIISRTQHKKDNK